MPKGPRDHAMAKLIAALWVHDNPAFWGLAEKHGLAHWHHRRGWVPTEIGDEVLSLVRRLEVAQRLYEPAPHDTGVRKRPHR